MANNILTTTLNNGTKVLGTKCKSLGIRAKTYANVTQAENKRRELIAIGLDVEVIGRRPFYVRIND